MNRYFDYTSTTPMNDEMIKLYGELLKKYYVNADSLYPSGQKVNAILQKAREKIALDLNVLPKEVIFTSCGSESNNTAIKGVALKRKDKGKHIISTCVEHSSVLNSLKWLHDYLDYEITYLPVNSDGKIDVEDLKKAMRQDTILVSIMMVNNESGALMPIDEVKKIVRKYPNCYLHVDCVQALGKMNLDLKDIDLASFSAHKINGLKGSGLLIKKQHVMLAPLISGGQQEYHLRAGTENVPADILFAKVLDASLKDLDEKINYVQSLHDHLWDELTKMEDIVINSPKDGSPFILNFSCLKITSQVMMNALAQKGFEVSAMSTCDSENAYSHVISQMYKKDENRLKGTIRVSLSHDHQLSDVDDLINAIKECIRLYG